MLRPQDTSTRELKNLDGLWRLALGHRRQRIGDQPFRAARRPA